MQHAIMGFAKNMEVEPGGTEMKYMRQFLLILGISFLGEGLKELLPLPIPASIYGLILLFVALELHIIQIEAVRDAGRFLIEIMPLMFIPAAVGLMESWDTLKVICIPVIVIMVVSTVVVMAVSGRVTQFVIRKRQKGEVR